MPACYTISDTVHTERQDDKKGKILHFTHSLEKEYYIFMVHDGDGTHKHLNHYSLLGNICESSNSHVFQFPADQNMESG